MMEFINRMVSKLVEAMFWVFQSIINLFLYVVQQLFTLLNGVFPNLVWPDMTLVQDFWATADFWIPLTEGSALMIVWLTVWLSVFAVRSSLFSLGLAAGAVK